MACVGHHVPQKPVQELIFPDSNKLKFVSDDQEYPQKYRAIFLLKMTKTFVAESTVEFGLI